MSVEINSVSNYQGSGFETLANASSRLSQQTIEANVRSSAEKILRADNDELTHQKARLETENRQLSRDNDELQSKNKELSQEVYDLQSLNQKLSQQEPSTSNTQETRFEEDKRIEAALANNAANSVSQPDTSSSETTQAYSNNAPDEIPVAAGVDVTT